MLIRVNKIIGSRVCSAIPSSSSVSWRFLDDRKCLPFWNDPLREVQFFEGTGSSGESEWNMSFLQRLLLPEQTFLNEMQEEVCPVLILSGQRAMLVQIKQITLNKHADVALYFFLLWLGAFATSSVLDFVFSDCFYGGYTWVFFLWLTNDLQKPKIETMSYPVFQALRLLWQL